MASAHQEMLLRVLTASLVLTLAAPGCTGLVVEPAGETEAGAPPLFKAPTTPIRRLTITQIENSVHAVFGDGITVELPSDVDASPETFSSIEAGRATVSRRTAETYEDAAVAIAEQVMADADRYPELAGCATSPDEACSRAVLAAFGEQLFRRPLEAEELDRYVAVVTAAGAEPEARQVGLTYAIGALLASPSFLYLHHQGEEGPDGERRFTDEELAGRLAIFIWDAIPDPELVQAARSGELRSAAGIEAQARRMLADPRARGLATRFFSEAWRVHLLDEGAKSTEAFPDWSAEVASLYRQEFNLFLERRVMENDEDLRVLFTSETTYANAALGELYGIDVEGEEFVEAPLPDERRGLITSGAVMAANANPDRTSPTHRGIFVLGQFLCGSTPDPPEGIDLSVLDRTDGMTGREIVELHLSEPSCAGCHQVFDPLGLAFESFDAMGRYRTEEEGQPVDARVEYEDVEMEGALELVDFLVADERTPECLARNLYSFAVGAPVSRHQVRFTQTLGQGLAESWSFHDLVVAIVTSPEYRRFVEPKLEDTP